MDRFEQFVDNYVEVAKLGAEKVRETVVDISWFVFGVVIIIIMFPLWVVGKITYKEPEPQTELEKAFKSVIDIVASLNNNK